MATLWLKVPILKGSYFVGSTNRINIYNSFRKMVHLMINPTSVLLDEDVDICVQKCKSGQNITLGALLKDDKNTFISNAYFVANDSGFVSANEDASVGGTFKGYLPMGLFTSLRPEGDPSKVKKFKIVDVTVPSFVHIGVFDGHVNIDTEEVFDRFNMRRSSIEWRCFNGDVKRYPVREGNIRATLFVPNDGKGQHPGIIDLFGSTGGLVEYRAALLASRGFTVLALAFLGFEDLPQQLEIEFDYFKEAIEWFSSNPHVLDGGVGMIGISKGAQCACYCAALNNQVKAVVSLCSGHFLESGIHKISDKELTGVFPDSDFFEYSADGKTVDISRSYLEMAKNLPEDSIIPVEKANQADFLFIHGTDDRMYHWSFPIKMAERMHKHGLDNNFELHIYQKAGHLLEPGYMPVCSISWHRLFAINMSHGGSSVEDHALAQINAWRKTIKFFKTKLPKKKKVPTASLR